MEKVRTIASTVELERHPLSSMFPDLSEGELQSMVTAIHEHGQRDPIVLFEGKVLDGWQRWRACKFLGRDCSAIDIEGSEKELAAFVYDMGITRRNLNKGQRSMIGADLLAEFSKDAKKRKKSGKKATGTKGSAASQAGKAAGVSAAYIQYAEKIKAQAPDLAAEVLAGKMTIPQANAELKKRTTLDNIQDELNQNIQDNDIKQVFFSASEISDRILKPLAAALRGLRQLKEDKTGLAQCIDEKLLTKAVSHARGIARAGSPFCLTPADSTDKAAKKRGWMSREEYHRFVNIEDVEESAGAEASNGEAKHGAKKRKKKKAKAAAK